MSAYPKLAKVSLASFKKWSPSLKLTEVEMAGRFLRKESEKTLPVKVYEGAQKSKCATYLLRAIMTRGGKDSKWGGKR